MGASDGRKMDNVSKMFKKFREHGGRMLAGDFEEGIRGVLEEFSFQEV